MSAASLGARAVPAAVESGRERLFLDGLPGPVSVFVHRPRPEAASGTWLALLPPFAHEHSFALRALFEIGERLAARGIGTVRLDPQGQGNSLTSLEGASVGGWLAELDALFPWLRADLGAGTCVAAGVRLGGLVALAAAAGGGWDAALAISAPPDGEAFWRDLARKQRLPALAAGGEPPGPVELRGYAVPPRLVREVRGLRGDELLSKLRVPLLLAESTATPGTPTLRSGGLEVRREAYRPFWAYEDVHASAVLEPLVAGLLEGLPAAPTRSAAARLRPAAAQPGPPLERPVAISCEGETVRGVFHEAGAAGDVAALVLDGGGNDCCGPHRILLDCARALAARGVPTLRHDSRGRGESGGRTCESTMSLAELLDVAASDALACAEWLRDETGCRRFLMIGFCEGAEIALLLPGVLGMPAHVIAWSPFDSFTEESIAGTARFLWNATPGLLRDLASSAIWHRLWRRELDVRKVVGKLYRQTPFLARLAGGRGRPRRHWRGTREAVPDLSRVERVLAIYAADDSLTPQASEHYRRLCESAGVLLDEERLPGGHSFYPLASRARLLEATLDWVARLGIAPS